MKIELGKKYLTRHGKIVKILSSCRLSYSSPFAGECDEFDGLLYYTEYGRYGVMPFKDHYLDLLSEYQEPKDIATTQPRLTVRLTSFPEANGKRNWTALLVRVDKWEGLVGNCGGVTVAHGELWNRVAYEAERAKFLIGERDTEPFVLDYGDDILTPEEWTGEGYESRFKHVEITARGMEVGPVLHPSAVTDLSDAADALERLTAGEVELPTLKGDREGRISIYTAMKHMKHYGDRRAAAAVLTGHAAPAPQWLPIKSAPTETEVFIGRWIDGKFIFGRSERVYEQANDLEGGTWSGWVWTIDDCSDSVAEAPTHWMPLPPPPEAAMQAELDELRKENQFLQMQISGWKADQKENLHNQCELQARLNAWEKQEPVAWTDNKGHIYRTASYATTCTAFPLTPLYTKPKESKC
jgi:hypothetical protein